MTAARYPDFFNDVFGPVMQPGSSSHTAGPCRLAYLASCLLDEPPAAARVELDPDGSFAGTFGVMAEDRALVAGILGLLPDDERLFRSFELAESAGLEVAFAFTPIAESRHPNAVKVVLRGRSGLIIELVGESIGGGMVETVMVDGFPWRTTGDVYSLLLQDPHELLGAAHLEQLATMLPQPAGLEQARAVGRGTLHVWSLLEEPDRETLAAALHDRLGDDDRVVRTALLRPLLPVLSGPDRKPQLFDTMTGWRTLAKAGNLPLWEVAVQYETASSGWSRAEVVERMRELAAIMRRQTRAAYDGDVAVPVGPFRPDFAGRWARHADSPVRISDGITARTIKYAYGAGAGIPGVTTVPGPMGSGGGYIHAALSAVCEAHGLGEDDLLHGLFVAAGVGAIAYTRTAPTGEVLGCAGEAGICGAMAAAAIVQMVGGPPQAVEDAASLALQAYMGLPCDPIPGGLSQPCRSRIMAATCTAHVFADLALAGHEAVLPLHEAIDITDRLGRALPVALRCTSDGGCCDSPTAVERRDEYQRWLEESPSQDRPPGNLI